MRFLRADRAASETARLWRSRMRPQLLPDPARLLDLGSGVSDSHSPSGSSREVALRRPDKLQADGRILFPDVHCPGLSLLICGISFPVKRIGDSLASLLEMRVYRNGPDRYTHLRFQCPAGKIAQKSACGTALLKASPHARSSVCKVRLENLNTSTFRLTMLIVTPSRLESKCRSCPSSFRRLRSSVTRDFLLDGACAVAKAQGAC